MKKILLLFLSLVVFSCATDNDIMNTHGLESDTIATTKLSESFNGVQLIKAWTSYSFYRGFGTYNRRFTVAVTDFAFEKKVSIFHEKKDGTWVEIPMQYARLGPYNSEIWELDNVEFGTETLADQFVIKYEVNGKIYWDNNNNTNYQMSMHGGYMFAESDLNISVDTKFSTVFYSSYEDQNVFNILVDVKNLSPSKQVEVLYTTDGWETQNYASLKYIRYWYNGYGKVIESPNDFGVERWQGSVRLDTAIQNFEYVVVYKVNGQEYWDNNYGRNYLITTSN